jgi:hypothetical protein
MLQQTAVYLTWEELFDTLPTETEVRDVIRTFNRQSTVVLLARLAIQLFLDQCRRDTAETIYLQSFLISDFMDDELLDRAKQRMPTDTRRIPRVCSKERIPPPELISFENF